VNQSFYLIRVIAALTVFTIVHACSSSTPAPVTDAAPADSARTGDTSGTDVTAPTDPISTTCNTTDRFKATDLGKVITASMIDEIPTGAAIADNTSYRMEDGRVRLYFIASWHSSQPPTPANGSPANGIHSAVSSDGKTFTLEDGVRIGEPAGHPKLFQVDNGHIRMFHLIQGGLGSQYSEDGLTFTEEDGVRILSADAEMERVGGMSVIQLPDGTYRGYFSNLGVPGVPPGEATTQIKSAVSSDLLDWTVEDGVRIGEGSTTLPDKSRQPFALKRAGQCVTLFYYQIGSLPTKIHYATSTDGLTFESDYELGIEGYNNSEAGPNIQRLSDGSYIMYFDAHDDTDEWHIRASRLEFVSP
jgi:hypothetical protein